MRAARGKSASGGPTLAEGNTILFLPGIERNEPAGWTRRRAIDDAIAYFHELADRKNTILKTIAEAESSTTLRQEILACRDKKALEEIYLPYKPNAAPGRRSPEHRGAAGRDPPAAGQPGVSREQVLKPYINPAQDVPDGEAALRGACDIVAEAWADDAEIRSIVREMVQQGMLVSQVKRDWAAKPSKFEMYYDHREPLAKVPSHRYLAMRRGEAEGVLRVGIELDDEAVIRRLTGRLVTNPAFLFRRELVATVADCYERLLFPSVESSFSPR